MNITVTQENVHLLLPNIISRVTELISTQTGISTVDALVKFYHSKVYAMLEDEQSKYWQWGSVALFEEYMAQECPDN